MILGGQGDGSQQLFAPWVVAQFLLYGHFINLKENGITALEEKQNTAYGSETISCQ